MKKFFNLRSLLIAFFSITLAFSAVTAFGSMRENQVAFATGETTVSVDYSKSFALTDVRDYEGNEGIVYENGSYLQLGSANNQSSTLFLYSDSSGTKDTVVTLTFNTGVTGWVQDNKIKSGEFLRLRYASNNEEAGGNITVAPANDSYALTQVRIVFNSMESSAYAKTTVTDLSDQVSVTYALGSDTSVFESQSGSYLYAYSNTNGFKSFNFASSRKSETGKNFNIRSIEVSYVLLGNSYDVTFESNGGTSVIAQTIPDGGKIDRPADPKKPSTQAKYEFGGWYSDEQLTQAFDFDTPVTADMILYAKWNQVENGTYSATLMIDQGQSTTITAEPGSAFARPSDPVKASTEKYSYSFDNWYEDEQLTSLYDWDTPSSEDITLYSKWNFGYAPMPENAVEYSTDANISAWGSEYSSAASVTLDSYETFDTAKQKPHIVWSVEGAKTGRGLYIQGGYNTIVKGGATSTFSLSEDSGKVITYIRIELRNWATGETMYLYANDGETAVDSQTLDEKLSSSPYYLLQASFSASDEVTSVKFTIHTDSFQIFIRKFFVAVEEAPALSQAKSAALKKIAVYQSNYGASDWASVEDQVEQLKTSVESATTVDQVQEYLAAVEEVISSLDDTIRFIGANVTLNESLALNYYVYVPAEIDQNTLSVNFSYAGGTVADTIRGKQTDTDGQYKFTYAGISPHRIGDTILVKLLVGNEVFAQKHFVMTDYFNILLSSTAAELGITDTKYSAMRTLIGDICDYGAKAQRYLDPEAETLVNQGFEALASPLAEVDSAGYRSIAGEKTGEATFKGVAVRFDGESKLYVTVYAQQEALSRVLVTVKVGDGEVKTVSGASMFEVSLGVYGFYTQSIKATEFERPISVVLSYDGEIKQTLTYSVKSYVYAKQVGSDALADLVKALWKYGVSAIAYLNA